MNNLTLYQFSKEDKLKHWHVVNDEVMGGISMGLIQLNKDGNGVFSGHVSLENNGGFCLVRHDLERIEVSNFTSFEIRLRGDGKKYQFRCKSGEHQRHSYIYHFTSSKEWTTITIPFKKMQPYFRGDALKLDNYHGDFLSQIGILIGNNKEEDFSLTLDYIRLK